VYFFPGRRKYVFDLISSFVSLLVSEEEDYEKQDHVKSTKFDIRKRSIYETENEVVKTNENINQNHRRKKLVVTRVLNKRFQIPNQTRVRHIYDGPYPFTSTRAIEVSLNRSENINYNTVFNNPYKFLECDTLFGTLIISRQPVQAYQCTRINGQWTATSCGKVHAVFNMNGNHFPGPQYLFQKIVFTTQN